MIYFLRKKIRPEVACSNFFAFSLFVQRKKVYISFCSDNAVAYRTYTWDGGSIYDCSQRNIPLLEACYHFLSLNNHLLHTFSHPKRKAQLGTLRIEEKAFWHALLGEF